MWEAKNKEEGKGVSFVWRCMGVVVCGLREQCFFCMAAEMFCRERGRFFLFALLSDFYLEILDTPGDLDAPLVSGALRLVTMCIRWWSVGVGAWRWVGVVLGL